MPVIPKRQDTACRGCYSIVKHLGLARKRQSASSTSRPEEAGESSTSCWYSGRRGDRPWVQIPPARREPLSVGGMFYCYVLRSPKTGRLYIGSCENLTERIRHHNAGDSKATKHEVPRVLLYSESFATRSEAVQRERYYKTGRGRDETRHYSRAVAEATGRGFKSHQLD